MDKKSLMFPDTHEDFSFVVDIVKRFQLHFALDLALDPLQVGAVMQFVWKSIGYMFWKQQHLESIFQNSFPSINFILLCLNMIYTTLLAPSRSWRAPLF
jgi:hypothetical protein